MKTFTANITINHDEEPSKTIVIMEDFAIATSGLIYPSEMKCVLEFISNMRKMGFESTKTSEVKDDN